MFLLVTALSLGAAPAPRTGQAAPGSDSPNRTGVRSEQGVEFEDGAIDPDRAALYGILPGGGQWYLGQEGMAFFQLGLFITAEYFHRDRASRDDYIPPAERRITFSTEAALIAHELRKNDLLYADRTVPSDPGGMLLVLEAYRQGLTNPLVPGLIGESRVERAGRMARAGQAVEFNPLLEYGGRYDRTNATTIEADGFGDLARWTLFYSVFSADRDARAFNDGVDSNEDFVSLSAAPFQTEFVKDAYIWLPVLVTPFLLEYERARGQAQDPLTALPYRWLAPPGTLDNRTTQATLAGRSLGAAIAEEALFRGVVHRRLTGAYGFVAGSALTGSLYAAYQYGSGNENIWPQMAYSVYWSYLEARGNDLRPSVASHFWTNVAILLFSLHNARSDERAGFSGQEVHFMPLFFTFDA